MEGGIEEKGDWVLKGKTPGVWSGVHRAVNPLGGHAACSPHSAPHPIVLDPSPGS